MDALYRSAGLRVSSEPDEDVQLALVDAAQAFLIARGTLTLADWANLSDESRAAFITAGQRLDVAQALRIGACVLGSAEAVAAEIDGGKAARARYLEGLCSEVLMVPRSAEGRHGRVPGPHRHQG